MIFVVVNLLLLIWNELEGEMCERVKSANVYFILYRFFSLENENFKRAVSLANVYRVSF